MKSQKFFFFLGVLVDMKLIFQRPLWILSFTSLGPFTQKIKVLV